MVKFFLTYGGVSAHVFPARNKIFQYRVAFKANGNYTFAVVNYCKGKGGIAVASVVLFYKGAVH